MATLDPAAAAGAYGRGASLRASGPAHAAPTEGGKPFLDVLAEATQDMVGTIRRGEEAVTQSVAGKRDLPALVEAVTDADFTLQTFIALRDKVIDAYQNIMRMPL
ncbi:MAG TPA: flagellar hook-basal body complex protein FliE [Rhodospirillaceae bacterium]|jgi:flagellar hook-basal body complex protein FliE|nr:flagellar hook-basal body complex protein FliE [Alphaproteobacteria bacterium]HBH26010.1 flagellar hook-basal body complex protein FliE [Rhodospirillaceae bacterium]